MKKAYVVRELVSGALGEKEFRTHYEHSRFMTYEAANQCAAGIKNQNFLPQSEDFKVTSTPGADLSVVEVFMLDRPI